MAESFDSERYNLASQRLTEMLERGIIDQEFVKEVLSQVRLFDERFPTPQDLPPEFTILVMSGRFIQAASLNDALDIAKEEGIEERPYYCEETPPLPSRGVDLSGFGTPNLPILPNSPTLGYDQERLTGLSYG